MQTLTVERENTRVAYDDAPAHRVDRTPGHMPLPLSPFTEPEQVAAALQFVHNGSWHTEEKYLGDLGNAICAIDLMSDSYKVLWRDARGGWWIQKTIRRATWIPDLDETEELAEKSRKPVKTCRMHSGSLTSDFACKCGRCAVDRAAMRRWEINVGMRCDVCGNRIAYCECNQ